MFMYCNPTLKDIVLDSRLGMYNQLITTKGVVCVKVGIRSMSLGLDCYNGVTAIA